LDDLVIFNASTDHFSLPWTDLENENWFGLNASTNSNWDNVLHWPFEKNTSNPAALIEDYLDYDPTIEPYAFEFTMKYWDNGIPVTLDAASANAQFAN
jgi:hypothetical protein